MTSELRWAVTDGPAGMKTVTLTMDVAEARRLDRHYGGGFWCSRAAGGCGGRLVVDAAAPTGPCFRHGPDARCAFPGREADAAGAYSPLRYGAALTAWLSGQGHRPRVGRTRVRYGRHGLHLVIPEVGAVIEVQLAPLSDLAWRERDDRYRAWARQVTWLYGPEADASAATEAAVRGVALGVRRHGAGLAVGVRDADNRTRWVRLTACRLTGDGFTGPGVEEARARYAGRAAERKEAARRVARETARRSAGHTPTAERAAIRWSRTLRPLPFAG